MSFWRNYYHLVWATKGRQPFIQPLIERRLFDYMRTKALELEVTIYAIDGTADHVHLVVAIPPKQSVANVVQHLKGSSSHFVNAHLRPVAFHFAWQDGYGCLTVGERHKDTAIAYVLGQKEHHAAGSVNAWLERCSPDEEGPAAATAAATAAAPTEPRQLAESHAAYVATTGVASDLAEIDSLI